ncbi:TPA: fimbrial biogenesis usher protein [Klebsiella pneumoniae]
MSHLKYGADQIGSPFSRLNLMSVFSLAPLPVALWIAIYSVSTHAELYFNPRFLSDDPAAVADLSSFEKGQEVPPGTYRVDIYLNEGYMTTKDVSFSAAADGYGLIPCLTRGELSDMGVNASSVDGINALESDACVSLSEMIKDSTTNFDVGKQRLNLTVPQSFMASSARGYIPPELWDSGINAGILNYNFTGNTNDNKFSGSSNYAYLNLQSGINLGAWRLRDNTTWSYSSEGSSGYNSNNWQHVNTWLERDIVSLQSRLTLGDSYTDSDIFNGLNFRGIQISTDDNMLPDSQKGFAPVIHGIARGTAQIIIKQNGYEIYQGTVPPGPFTINDIFAAGNGGDLQVTVKEADGSNQVFTVPYSSVPILQREGYTRYSLTAGEYRSGNNQQTDPNFFQGTFMRGLPYGWTVYGGTQLAERYQAYNLGVGKNMGVFGAFSLDVTQADTKLPDDTEHEGQSVRMLYNKSLIETGTNFQLIGYRYSTRGYFDFADTTYNRMKGSTLDTHDGLVDVQPKYTGYYNLAYSKRGKVQVGVSQQLGSSATLYLNASRQSYWGANDVDEQLQAGINTTFGGANWSLNYSLSKNAWQDGRDQMLALNVNVPFSNWLRSDNKSNWRNAYVSYSSSHDLNGRMTNMAGINGTLLEDNNLGYSIQTGYVGGGQGNSSASGNASLNYRGGYGNANVGYSQNRDGSQLYYGMSGGILAHADGITLSQPLNSTSVLVKVPGAGDVRVENQTGVTTDWRGYAVIPYATEYRENRIALNTNTLEDNVELDESVVRVVPTHGAIVRADFKVNIGLKILMTLTRNGKPVPFGAVVSTEGSKGGSIVADNGQVYLSGMPQAGKLQVKWGDSADSRCVASYSLHEESLKQALVNLAAECR